VHLRRYFQYLKERFPFEQFVMLSLFFASAAGTGAQMHRNNGIFHPGSLLLATAALYLFLLRLRFFDEFKDFEHDSRYYKNRPVCRGLVTLKELRFGIYAVLALECLIAGISGISSIILFFASLLYSLLMFEEFFLREWLRKHFAVYFISHELLIFPLFLYLMSLNGMPAAGLRQSYFWLLAAFLGFNLFLLEITRKIRPESEEIESRDTYSARYGIKGSALLAFAISAASLALSQYLESTADLGGGWAGVFRFTAFAYFSYTLCIFVKRADRKSTMDMFYASIAYTFVSLSVFVFKCVYELL